ncbi:hypothetical protein [Ideonella margarita]|uniref:Uncharacterized protein n=1 Tax=Ideonella margarita TaxID=2984191 RepID=A0ABU9C676_9BURK
MKHAVAALAALLLHPSISGADDSWRITTRGYGPIRAGMTPAEAARLMGTRLKTFEDRPMDAFCDDLIPEKGFEGVSLMVQNGRITRLVISKPTVRTLSGIQVGDSTDRLKQVFGSRLEIQPHKYDDDGFYYFVWEQGKRFGVKFEIGGNRVTEIYAGDESIRYVEGCS